MNSDTLRLFFPNQQAVLWRREKKDERQFMAWDKGSYKVSCLPQAKAACVRTGRTGRTQQTGTRWLFSPEMLLCASSGDTGRFAPRKSDDHLEAWMAQGDKDWHKCAAAWSTLMGTQWSAAAQATEDVREELHQKAIISLRWWLIYCGIRSLCKSQNLAFLIIKNPHYGEKKLLSVCRKITVH